MAAISDATCLDTLARLLRDHGSDGPVSDESLTALARVLGEQQAAMPAEGKAVDAATWPVQQLRNARYAATLSPDLAAEFEPTAARILAALASAANRPDNGGERTAP